MTLQMTADNILKTLRSLGSKKAREGMERFGITSNNALGISTPVLKSLARKIGKSHELAAELWASGIFEARAIAALIDEPEKVTRGQMERWAKVFDSWAICDGCCCYLFRRAPFAWAKAAQWSKHRAEFVKRAGFSLMAYLAVHDKQADDKDFRKLLPIIEREARDERLYVRKAVNWALRQIGKRNPRLNRLAIQTAKRIRAQGASSSRWIAADALRELQSKAVQARLAKKKIPIRVQANS
jgi:3-methyladenine DNA glycosylase AlkD